EKSSKSYQQNVIGVISTEPGVLLGKDATSSKPVALAGRVPVKISTENGEIKTGDFLTSASLTPGVAMKATKSGMIIGMALESYNNSEIGKITVFVNPHWVLGALTEDGTIASNEENQIKNEELGIVDSFVEKVKQALASLGLVVENGVAKAREIMAEKITAKKVETRELQMIDKATNETYCSWIENGEWVKVKGKCETTTEAKAEVKTEAIETVESPLVPIVPITPEPVKPAVESVVE
ncbi:MAG: hypothetical protein Q7T79_04040, partial [bacterium]|nr:hypothetical protein [bacterium]